MAASAARLSELVRPEVAAVGYDLEALTVTAAGRRSVVRVVVDKDGGVTLDDVADVSRTISDVLDRVDEDDPSLLGTTYVLEVSSPGVDRPLTEPRHWRRNVGRLVRAVPREGSPVTGRLAAADDVAVTLDVDGQERLLPLVGLVRGEVQVEFARKGEPVTDDLDDADDDADDDGVEEESR
jgi:ribosome maturation factor RimP